MALIDVEDLTKTFRVLEHRRGTFGAVRNLFSSRGKTVTAVDRIRFRVEAGEFIGYVGPNGAGKSTTIKMLTGILVPTSGRAVVCGIEPYRERQRNGANIGVVFGQRSQLWWDLPPRESFELIGRIYRIERKERERRVGFFTELLELADYLDTPVRKLSLGERMRCDLTAALLHDPKLLYLDEPTIGLDVVAKQQIRDYLRVLNREHGTTILLTSHDLDDIEALCPRVMVIDRGRVIHDGTLDELRHRFGNSRRLIADFASDVRSDLRLPAGAMVVSQEGRRVEIQFDADRLGAPDLIRALFDAGEVRDFELVETDIEDVVRRIYEGRGRA